jgi:hypothetical protein
MQTRDKAREAIVKTKHAQGFAQNDALAIDFEKRKQDVARLRAELEALEVCILSLAPQLLDSLV